MVDNNASSPMHFAAHNGHAALLGMFLQWAAAQAGDVTLGSLASSSLVSSKNSFGNTALHYAFYCAHLGPQHVECVRALVSTGLSLTEPLNNSGKSPLQLFAAPDTECGHQVCWTILKMSVEQVQAQVRPPKKAIKKRGQTQLFASKQRCAVESALSPW